MKRPMPDLEDEPTEEEEQVQPPKRKSPRTKVKGKSSAGVDMSLVDQKKKAKKYIEYPNSSKEKVVVKKVVLPKPKKAVVEKKYAVDYTKGEKLEWFEETGASYRATQEKKKMSEKQALSKQLMAKTETLTHMSQGILDLGKDLARQVADPTDEDPDMLWMKSLLPDFKSLPVGTKNRLKIKIMSLIYDSIDQEK